MAAEIPAPCRFPASRRLKQGRDFARTRTDGRRLVLGCLILNWAAAKPGAQTRLGVITSRQIGGAVIRSRSRRLLRESFRLHQHELNQPVDLVLVARRSIAGKSRQSVERDYLTALHRSGLLREKPSSTTPAPSLPTSPPADSRRAPGQ